jgi:hypothetical protein
MGFGDRRLADGDRSARRVRAHVRSRRKSGGPQGSSKRRSQHPGFDIAGSAFAADQSRCPGSRPPGQLSGKCS